MKRFLITTLFLMFVFNSTSDAGRRNPPLGATATTVIAIKLPQRGGQVGATCVASPYCPDCERGGNVCLGAKEFFGGLTVLVAKRYMIDKCRRANALDYCGGSRGCVRRTRQEQESHRARYGGGCYKSCEKSIVCYIDSR